ncbi:unnamed protein product [Toxocara canis]|uniref:DUF3700 domain-containing protein n=1 Tax=Toxocara canis TaxID=6265 RepID=A0A183U9M3_TOXCA|nr:unnamed protein product [Toxocara canis]
MRADINTAPSHHRTVRIENIGDELLDEEDGEGGARLYIWGTRICVVDVQRAFRRFLQEFKPSKVADDENVVMLASSQSTGLLVVLVFFN